MSNLDGPWYWRCDCGSGDGSYEEKADAMREANRHASDPRREFCVPTVFK